MWNFFTLMALSSQYQKQNSGYDPNQPFNETEHKIIDFIASIIAIWFKFILVALMFFVAYSTLKIWGYFGAILTLIGYFALRLYLFKKSYKSAAIFSNQTRGFQYTILSFAIIVQSLWSLVRFSGINFFSHNWLKGNTLIMGFAKACESYVFTLPYFAVLLIVVPLLEKIYVKLIKKDASPYYDGHYIWSTNILIVFIAYTFFKLFQFGLIFIFI